jgi:hypothetical protein
VLILLPLGSLIMKGAKMSERITITLPKKMPLSERISGVSKEISKWLKSLEEPFNIRTDVMHLAGCERNDKYSYHYVLDRAAKGPVRESDQEGAGA